MERRRKEKGLIMFVPQFIAPVDKGEERRENPGKPNILNGYNIFEREISSRGGRRRERGSRRNYPPLKLGEETISSLSFFPRLDSRTILYRVRTDARFPRTDRQNERKISRTVIAFYKNFNNFRGTR